MALHLGESDRSLLDGEDGAAAATAMRILVSFAEAVGAESFLDIARAHIDGCLYHGQVNLDFVEQFVATGGRVRVPTSLNVGAVDLIHPELMLMNTDDRERAGRLMKAHELLGCHPSFTCAPYQTLFRPAFGEQIAWGESNAIVFANSVIGARTNRYGDFIDLCCALTGRAPAWGLHLDENRRGEILFRLCGFPPSIEASDTLYVAIGLIIGAQSSDRIPVIEGLPPPRDEDQLKALGAAAASTGSVGLFHIISVTPEAPTMSAAFGGREPATVVTIAPEDVTQASRHLSRVPDGTPLTAVCLGTPHFSRREWNRLLPMLRQAAPHGGVPIYINTDRDTLRGLEQDGSLHGTDAFGVIAVADTCTYLTAILKRLDGTVMTNSGKWAHYAPGNLGVQVAFGSLEDCVTSAVTGCVTRSMP